MRDRAELRHRLGQYSALWLGGFLLVLIAAAAASLVAGLDLIEVADLVLPVAFALLGGALLYGVGAAAASRAGLGTKSLIVGLALLLVLPLLWAPVLAVLVVAATGGAVIEYSTAYAQFRIAVSQIVYPLMAPFTDSPLAGAVWAMFQVVASVVGFLASAAQVIRVIRGFLVDDGDGDVETA
jgi:hypothetical protein